MARWVKGQSGNPNGRPKRGDSASERLQEAIARVEKEDGIDVMEAFVRMAMKEPSVMVALQRKLIADLRSVEVPVKDENSDQSSHELPPALQEMVSAIANFGQKPERS